VGLVFGFFPVTQLEALEAKKRMDRSENAAGNTENKIPKKCVNTNATGATRNPYLNNHKTKIL